MKIYKTLPDGIQIVEYEDDLAQTVADMWNRSGEGWGGIFGGGVWTAGQVAAKRATGAFFNVYVALKDGEAVGYCSLDRYTKDEDTAYLHLLNVRPDYHGKKIGKELVLMCVNETMALGMPRLDINTWPGNTKSVPLYKKCGFLWEDRSDNTRLSNFIPTVLSTGLLKDYFKKADWYADSTRKIELKPDGVKVDKFEFYGYEWEKDGQHLRVEFEKTGRRIRRVETNDYIIELTAVNHELAFGLRYPCRFLVVNKTGKALDIAITAKNDGVISFDGAWSEQVENEALFEADFFVGAVKEELDPWRMHPCVLADVCVNGGHVELGLGIEPKFPVTISLAGRHKVSKRGTTEEMYINIKNDLLYDAEVSFALPENPLMLLEQTDFEVNLTNGGDVMLVTRASITNCGCVRCPVSYKILLGNGDSISFTRPLYVVNHGIDGMFAFETDEHFGAANGLWRLRLDKQTNIVNFDRIMPSGHAEFHVPSLGKPYDDEFNMISPHDVRVTEDGANITFEADFLSKKFGGAVLTEIYEFDAAGTLMSRHRVSNRSENPMSLSLKAIFFTNAGKRAVFHHEDDFHKVADDMNYGFDTLKPEKLDENWIFDSGAGCPTGIWWPQQYKPETKWGEMLEFEHETGRLMPGQSFETESVVYMCGVFGDFRDFRNYVLGINDETVPFVRNHLEMIVNGGNPVLSADTLALAVRNNRLNIREGTITVSSPDTLFPEETRENPKDELIPETAFLVPIAAGKSGVGVASFSLKLSGFEHKHDRALFITNDTQIVSGQKDGVLTVKNGDLRFSVAPGFSDAAYSLEFNGNEWFHSNCPSLEPYSWWNPYVGGLKSYLERLGNLLLLRESISASFASETDILGNIWTGIRADVSIGKNDEYKGMRYSQYYLTLPGVPIMCHFMRLENGAGRFMDAELYSMLFLSGKEGLPDIVAGLSGEDGIRYDLRFCGGGHELRYDRLIAFSRDGLNKRREKLYVFKDSKRDHGKSTLGYDINIAYCDFNMKGSVPSGGHLTTKPVFCILTEKELTLEALTDLSRIEFN